MRKLGKLAPKYDPRTLKMDKYLDHSKIPTPPLTLDYSKPLTEIGMMRNDELGDCTIASAAHMIQVWTANATKQITLTDDQVVKGYSDICGYVPGDPSTDNGGIELFVLNYWRTQGISGHKIKAYVALEEHNLDHIKAAIWLFGGAYIGLGLPVSAQRQNTWKVSLGGSEGDITPNSWGGHAVNVVGYDSKGLLCMTWGTIQRMTYSWWDAYCVTPETKVITDKLEWKNAGDIKTGDQLSAFDEDGPYRRWRKATVLSTEEIVLPCYELTFEDGTQVTCSGDHRWLCANSSGAHWVRTDHMRVDPNMCSNVVKPLDVWQENKSWEAGYLAAGFDGEGHLTQSNLEVLGKQGVMDVRLGFAQKPNSMLAEMESSLKKLDFNYTQCMADHGVSATNISGRRNILKFLGSVRPRRLLDKFDVGNMGVMTIKTDRYKTPTCVKLVERRFVGEKVVAAIKTDTGTFIANGLASHNCDESYALLSPDWFGLDGKSPSGFDEATLLADLNQVTG